MPRPLSDAEIQAFRAEACRVATRLFAEEGFAGVTLRGLAAELGCSAMTPYRYFANKEEIFDAVRLDAFRAFGEAIARVAAAHADPMERLRALGRGYVDFAVREPHRYRIMFQLDRAPNAVAPPEEEAQGQSWRVLLDTLRDCIAAGHLAGDPVDLAHYCWLGLHGAVTLHLADRLRWGRSLDDLVPPMLETLYRGAAARPQTEKSA